MKITMLKTLEDNGVVLLKKNCSYEIVKNNENLNFIYIINELGKKMGITKDCAGYVFYYCED